MWREEPTPTDAVIELQCNLDDMTGEELGFALERLLLEGALDVWFAPIQMKKDRPAVMLSVLARLEDADRLRGAMLEHTSTLGVRWRELRREVAQRQFVEVQTSWGKVRCKVKMLGGRVLGVKPEFDDCARLARQHGIPLRLVTESARQACSVCDGTTGSAPDTGHLER